MIHHAKTSAPADVFLRGRRLCLAPSQSKPVGFASSPKGRGKSTAGSFLITPNTLATSFKSWLPLGGKTSPGPGEDVSAGDKRGNLARERLRGRSLREFPRISMFCTNGAFSPCERCEKSLSIKSVMRKDATKIYLNKESTPCSRRQKAVFFKQTGQRPAQRDKSDNTM